MGQAIEQLASPGVHEKVLEIVRRLPGKKVFDSPAGQGAMTQELLLLGKTVTAGDIDVEQFKLDRTQKNLTLLKLDLTAPSLSVASNDFDVAICVEGIEHLENQWALVRNLNRLLKPGGFLLLSTPNIINFKSRFRFFWEAQYEFFKRPLVHGKSIAHDLHVGHIAPVSYFQLQYILERSGFSINELHANIYSSKNPLSMLLRPFLKLSYRYKNSRNKKRNRGDHQGLYDTIMSDELYYGETLIILAQKQ